MLHSYLFSYFKTKQAREIVESQLNTEGMSIREISVAKRKARLELKRQCSGYAQAILVFLILLN